MKLFTFFDTTVMVGMKVDQYGSVMIQGNERFGGDDYYVKLGNGDMTMGRLLVIRESSDIVQNNRIYSADLTRRLIGGVFLDYLEKENNTMDNRAFVLFRKIEPIADPILKNKDDYLKEVLPGEKLLFTNLFGEDFILINNLKPNNKTPRVEIDDNVFSLIS